MMFAPFAAVFAALFIAFAAPAQAGFEDGKAAYDMQRWRDAILTLRPLAENGDARALVLLGNMYSEGLGVAQDHGEAFISYRRAASYGNADGMVAVATFYKNGLGVEVNDPLAIKWFERAAKSGHQAGAFFYAIELYQGSKGENFDLKPDHPQAYQWMRVAAQGKNFPAMAEAADRAAREIAKKLIPEEVSAGDKAAKDFKPVPFADLGPAPDGVAEPLVTGYAAPSQGGDQKAAPSRMPEQKTPTAPPPAPDQQKP